MWLVSLAKERADTVCADVSQVGGLNSLFIVCALRPAVSQTYWCFPIRRPTEASAYHGAASPQVHCKMCDQRAGKLYAA